MKTTIELSESLFRAAKRHAAEKGISFKALLEASLKAQLKGGHRAKPSPQFEWTRVQGKANPLADINNREALWEFVQK